MNTVFLALLVLVGIAAIGAGIYFIRATPPKKGLGIGLIVGGGIAILVAIAMFVIPMIGKTPAASPLPNSGGNVNPVQACSADQVLYFTSNGKLNGGVDCTMSDGSLLSTHAPANPVVTSPLACTGDQVLYFVSVGSLKGGVDCELSDGTMLSAFKTASPVVTTVSACSADQVMSFMSSGVLVGGTDCTMADGTLLSAHKSNVVVTNPLPVGNGGSPVLNPSGGSNAPVAMTLRQDVLKYDMTDCDPANFQACVPAGQWNWYVADKANRHLFPALYIQNVQSGDLTPAQAIAAIQQMGAGWAQSADGWSTIAVDDRLATLVWNAQRNTCEYVPDTARPLENAVGTPEEWQNSIVIVSAHMPADPAAAQITVTCTTSDNWSTLMQ